MTGTGSRQRVRHQNFMIRFFGPLEGYIEKTWVLNDLELVD